MVWMQATWLFALLLITSAGVGEAWGAVLVEAHRGDSLNAPENTVASIQSAADSADLTEMDVRVTADGQLVLMHDSTVDRTTDGTGSVAGMTLPQLKTLDAGSWFSPAFEGEPVPTMAEAVAASIAMNIQPLIERKTGTASDYHAEFLAESLATDEFRVIAFDWGFLDDLDALNPAYNLGALGSGTINQSVIDTVAASGADFLDWNHGSVTQAAVDLVHANDMELHLWTVNDPTRMHQLIDYGIDGITTDNPALLRDLLPPSGTNPVLIIDRDTGDIRLKNVESNSLGIQGYSLQSAVGALDPTQWLSIADNYDAGSPGPDQIDPNDDWTELEATHVELSEAELAGGDGASIAGNSSVLLGSGVWLMSPLEDDIQMKLTLPEGATLAVAVEYGGNGGNPFAAGDFDFDGDIDAADWLIHNAGRGTDLTGTSVAQGYRLGDIDGTGEIDVVDFVFFKQRFEEANGAGSFAAMIAIPEPSTLQLLAGALLFFGTMRRAGSRRWHARAIRQTSKLS
jgi:glycerophosphoryl diester phosphodiesterase